MRRAQLLALVELPGGLDRYRQAEWLKALGWLAATLGDEELAYRCRRQSLAMYSPRDDSYPWQVLGGEAFRDEDWPAVVRALERVNLPAYLHQTHYDQLSLALDKVGRKEEARKLRDPAAKFRVEPGTYATQGAGLLTHGLKAEAAERLRTAARLLPPGDAATVNALNSLGNSLYEQTPGAATPLWQLNMLGPLRGTANMPLDTYVKNQIVTHRVQARDLIAQGKFREALAHCHKELDAMPGNVAVIDQVLPLFEAKDQRALADELFARSHQTYAGFCEKYPRSFYHRNILARTAARANRQLDEALRTIDEALAIDPERPELHATLSRSATGPRRPGRGHRRG